MEIFRVETSESTNYTQIYHFLPRQMLLEEKAVSERLGSERDSAEKDAREKEARVLALLRDNEEMTNAKEENERLFKGAKAELEELMSSKGIEAKNYHELEKAKRALESQVRGCMLRRFAKLKN